MLLIRKALESELEMFAQLETDPDTEEFIVACSKNEHLSHFRCKNNIYLTITWNNQIAGFVFLVNEGKRMELRRIVISVIHRGIGQMAMYEIHRICQTEYNANSIWLDVFEHNHRGRHIYRKLGYLESGRAQHAQGNLIIMEKHLPLPAADAQPSMKGAPSPRA